MTSNNTTTEEEMSLSSGGGCPITKKRWSSRLLKLFTPSTPPETLQYRQRIVDTFLHGDDGEIRAYVNQNKTVCRDKHSFGDGVGKMYPLSVVVVRRKPRALQKTVEAVYDAHPGAIHEALHHACARQATLDVIKFLVSKHPDGAGAQYEGWYPLHIALAGNADYHVVKHILDGYPAAIEQRARSDLGLPIHIAIEHCPNLDVIRLLLSRFPASIKTADYTTVATKTVRGWIVLCGEVDPFGNCGGGGLPLHLACRHNVPLPILKHLIIRYPDALKTKNRIGWLPLHYACSCRTTTVEFVEIVHMCCPDALTEHNVDFVFPVDMSISRAMPDMDTVRYLISRHPTLDPPLVDLFYHYHDEANIFFTGWDIIQFLRSVVHKASEGYTYVYPNEI